MRLENNSLDIPDHNFRPELESDMGNLDFMLKTEAFLDPTIPRAQGYTFLEHSPEDPGGH